MTEIQTEAVNTETASTENKKPELDPKAQAELALKAITVQYKGFVAGSRLHIRTLLNMLTSSGIDGNLKHQIKETIERAIVAAIDYGVDINGEAPVRTHGTLGKLESALAMQLAKAKECGMVILSDKLEKSLKKEEEMKGEKPNGEETKTETETSVETKTNEERVLTDGSNSTN